jgi:hypothetical protein
LISDSEEQCQKQLSPRISTLAGTEIDPNDIQLLNAHSPICDNLESEAKLISDSEEQCEKQPFPRIPTLEGIEIDLNNVQYPNAQFPICDNLDAGSKATEESEWEPQANGNPKRMGTMETIEWEPWKQSTGRTPTYAGIQIHWANVKPKNEPLPRTEKFESPSDVISGSDSESEAE